MSSFKKTIFLSVFLVVATIPVFAQNDNGKVNLPKPQISDIQLFNAAFLSFTNNSYLLVMHRFSNKVMIKMYESTGKLGPGQTSIRISDEAGVLQPRPTTVVFKSSIASINLTLDENWTINTSSLPSDTYVISINGKKIVEDFVVN